MKKLLSKIRRKLPSASPESCALLFVWFFLTIGLIVTVSSVAGEVTELAATSATKWQIIRECLFVAFSGCVLTAILAPLMGALCASVFMRRIVAEAYPAALVKRDFALADNGMLMGFIRQYKVGIYKTKSKLPDFVTYNVPARLDTFFPLPFYLPLFSLELIESGRICFEREEIENIKKRTLDSLVAAMPEVIQTAYDKEKGAEIESLREQLQKTEKSAQLQIQEIKDIAQTKFKELKESSQTTIQELKISIEEKSREIELLGNKLHDCKKIAQEQVLSLEESAQAQLRDTENVWRARLQELKEATDNERRDLKKRHTQAEKRVNEHLLLGYIGMRLVSQFHAARYGDVSISRFQATRGGITEAMVNLLHEEKELKEQLDRWQRSDKTEQDDVFYDLLRLAMPKQMVNWGGHSMKFDVAVKKYFKGEPLADIR